MRIPDADITRLNADTDLVGLIQSRGVALKQQGRNWTGHCPFHDDTKHANLIVTPTNSLWRCMAIHCGKTGNAIQFLEAFDGLSFRHAFELLAHGGKAAFERPPDAPRKQTTVPRLPCPLDETAPDASLLDQIASYYASRLAALENQSARDYLVSRGLDDEALWQHFGIGFSDRTLGLRIPEKNRKQGGKLRERLQSIGVYRPTGREHLNGCITIPIREYGSHGHPPGHITQIYGRRSDPKAFRGKRNLYLARPLAGIFNPAALASREIILTESILDALTFIRNGSEAGLPLMAATTCTFGTDGFTDELFDAIRTANILSVRLAFDADDAGELAAAQAAARLQAIGIECYRVRFPWGMDANTFALNRDGEALCQAVRSAEWLGGKSLQKSGVPAAACKVPVAPLSTVNLVASSLAADSVAEREEFLAAPTPANPVALAQRGEHHELQLGDRAYRVGGLDKNSTPEVMKITLRVMEPGCLMHIDSLDLYRDGERRKFIERAAEETGLTQDLLKRDLGKLLLALEQCQEERLAAAHATSQDAAAAMSIEDRRDADNFLKAPDLIERIGRDFETCGMVGEGANRLVGYLACTSRLLRRPLAVIIQSTSAAGKSTLMEAVLAMFPEEERIKYSAMTGQSLYYLGETNLKHKILAIVEEEGAEKASYALKLLQSEGELTIASTGKNAKTGQMETQTYHVEGPVTIFLTTTAIDIDEELQNRCLTLSVDESSSQTRRIHELQRASRTLAGIERGAAREDILRIHRNAQRLLESFPVWNPWVEQLTFTSERTRTRRDHEKYLTLIDAVTLLHQRQRQRITLPSGRTALVATLADIQTANRLAPEVLGRSLDELPAQTRRLWDEIKRLALEAQVARGWKHYSFTRRELRERVGWSVTQVRTHLERLHELEYIVPRHGRNGVRFDYGLLLDPGQAEGPDKIGLIDVKSLKPVKPCDYAANLTGESPRLTGKNAHLSPPDNPPVSGSSPDAAGLSASPDGLAQPHIRAAGKSASGIVA
jgi:DNA primase catalytic core